MWSLSYKPKEYAISFSASNEDNYFGNYDGIKHLMYIIRGIYDICFIPNVSASNNTVNTDNENTGNHYEYNDNIFGIELGNHCKIFVNACFIPNLLPSIYIPNIILDKMIKHKNAFKAICNDDAAQSQGYHYLGKDGSKNINDNNNDNDNDGNDSEYYIFEEFQPVIGGLGMDIQDNSIQRYQIYWIITALSHIFIPDVLIHLMICFVGPWCNKFASKILNDAEKRTLINIFSWHLQTYELYLEPLYFSKSAECGSCEGYIESINHAGPTVTIFKTTSGYVFGGYIGRNIWHDKKHTIKFHDPTSLLFNATTNTVYPLKSTNKDVALVQTHPTIFIEFGWDGDVVAGFVKEAGTIVMGYERSPFDSSSYQYYNDNYVHGKFGELDIEAIELLSISRK